MHSDYVDEKVCRVASATTGVWVHIARWDEAAESWKPEKRGGKRSGVGDLEYDEVGETDELGEDTDVGLYNRGEVFATVTERRASNEALWPWCDELILRKRRRRCAKGC